MSGPTLDELATADVDSMGRESSMLSAFLNEQENQDIQQLGGGAMGGGGDATEYTGYTGVTDEAVAGTEPPFAMLGEPEPEPEPEAEALWAGLVLPTGSLG